MEKFLTVEDMQEILQMGKSAVYRLVRTDGFPAIKIGGTYRVQEDELIKWAKTYRGKEFYVV